MGKNKFLVVLIWSVIVSTVHSYNFEYRFHDPYNKGKVQRLECIREGMNTCRLAGPQNADESSNTTRMSILLSSAESRCIAVEVVREFGCAAPSKVSHQYDPFESVCERHQLCYTCVSMRLGKRIRLCRFMQGSALGIQPWTCNQMANLQMFELCWDPSLTASSKYVCLKRRFLMMKVLGEHVYRSADEDPELNSECGRTCVLTICILNWSEANKASAFIVMKCVCISPVKGMSRCAHSLYRLISFHVLRTRDRREERRNEQFNSHTIVGHKEDERGKEEQMNSDSWRLGTIQEKQKNKYH